jgi:hypothetical protein
MPEFYLDFLKGERAGTALHFEQDVVRVGRSDEIEFSLEEMGVSWEHAEFRYRDGDYWIVDSGSTNGTYVNDERAHNARLKDGDKLKFGKKGPVLRFRLQTDSVVIPQSSSENPGYSVARDGSGELEVAGRRAPGSRRRLPSEPDFAVPVIPGLNDDPNEGYSDLPPAAGLPHKGPGMLLLAVPSVMFVVSLVLLGVLYMDYGDLVIELNHAQDSEAKARRDLEALELSAGKLEDEALEEERQKVERLQRELERTRRRADDRVARAKERGDRLERELSRTRRDLAQTTRELEAERRKVQNRAWTPSGHQDQGVKSWQAIEKRLSPSVVFIATRCKGKDESGKIHELNSYGTGFFASSQGHIVTNKHVVQPWKFQPLAERMVREGIEVVEGSYKIHVWRGGARFLKRGSNGKAALNVKSGFSTSNGTLELVRTPPDKWDTITIGGEGPRLLRVHADGDEDLALLKAKTSRISPIPLGRSDSVGKLDEVLVLGFPAGPSILEAGIAETSPARGTVRKVEHTIQVTAAMIGGNSGGPLIDRRGQVIGISTRVIKGTETLGSCIRIEHARELLYGGSW